VRVRVTPSSKSKARRATGDNVEIITLEGRRRSSARISSRGNEKVDEKVERKRRRRATEKQQGNPSDSVPRGEVDRTMQTVPELEDDTQLVTNDSPLKPNSPNISLLPDGFLGYVSPCVEDAPESLVNI